MKKYKNIRTGRIYEPEELFFTKLGNAVGIRTGGIASVYLVNRENLVLVEEPEANTFKIEVKHRNKWITVKKTFKTEKEAKDWGKWNYKNADNWRIK